MPNDKKTKVNLLRVAEIDFDTIPEQLRGLLEEEFSLKVSDLDTLILRCGCTSGQTIRGAGARSNCACTG